MSDYIVTGRTGQNHVTSADHGAANAAFAGTGRYVADGIGETLSAEVITNNLVRIHSGEVINQGRHMRVEANTYVDCTIENGSQSTKRYDLIVFRYTKNADTGMESGQIVVIKGTAGTTAADPNYTKGDILSGAVQDDMPLYRVRINGINIEGVDKLFSTVPSLAALNAKVSQLNSDLNTTINNRLGCIGTLYWSGSDNDFWHTGGGWIDTQYGITIPSGVYIITVTAFVSTRNNTLWDMVSIGVSNMNCYENQCTFNLTANNDDFYARCTHTFFTDLEAGTYQFSGWSQIARQFREVEIAAMRIK